MSTEAWFSDNYSDLSMQSGLNAGFQFQFNCERCGDAYRTKFNPYRRAQAEGWLNQASGFLGGLLGNADNAAHTLADAGWKSAWDSAFRDAVTEAKANFHRCAKCFQYMCVKCFDAQSGLCYNCAPNAEVELQAAKAAGKATGAAEVGSAYGYAEGQKMDAAPSRQLVCPSCNAETHGAKFCPECGTKLSTALKCSQCGTESAEGTKFCPECGTGLVQ